MKNLLFAFAFFSFSGFAQSLSGTYIVGASQAAPFNTLTNAVNRINTVGVSGPVVFLLDNNTYTVQSGETFPITIKPYSGSSATNTLTIKPSNGKTVTISAAGANSWSGCPAVFFINAADNVILDGSNTPGGNSRDLTIVNNDNISYLNRTAVWIASNGNDGASNVTVSNAKLQVTYRNQEHLLCSGIYAGNNTIGGNNDLAVNQASARNMQLVLANNAFVNARQGVRLNGNSSTGLATADVSIRSNTFGGQAAADKPSLPIYAAYCNNLDVSDNTIAGVLNNNTSNPVIAGIAIENSSNYQIRKNTLSDVVLTTNHIVQYGILVKGACTNGAIEGNRMYNIKNTGAGIVRTLAFDLDANTNSNTIVANNMLWDIASTGTTTNAAHGLFIQSGKNIKIYHNTVAMNAAQNNISAALYVNGGALLDVRNNIFTNTGNGGTRYAVYVNNVQAFSNMDYNDYYAPFIGYLGGSFSTLAQWQNATGQNSHSTNVSPAFSNGLHLEAADNAALNNTATPLSVTTDIDGDNRSLAAPDMGADEFNVAGCTGTTTWNGNSWSNGQPTQNTAAVFSGNYTATDDFTACSLTVSNNAAVVIATGVTVSLNGSLTIESGSNFTLEDDAALLQPEAATNSGNVKVKRTTGALMRQDYVLWSSPVSGQALQSFSPGTLANRFYSYNPQTDLYNVVADVATTTFEQGKGYLIRVSNTHPSTPTAWTGTFTGTLNNGTITQAFTPNTYNAVGNPYPSAIDADQFIKDNNLSGPLYFYRKTNAATTSAYATYTLAGGTATGNSGIPNAGPGEKLIPDGVIVSGQGFITKASGTSLTFTNAMRTTGNDGVFLRNTSQRNRIWVNLSGDAGFLSQALVAYMPDATTAVDAQLDGAYINDSETALTTLIEGNEFAVQARAPFESTDIVTVGFKAATAGTYTISIDHTDGLFADGQEIFLKDKLTGSLHSLVNGSYSFSTEAGVFNDRFEIVYQEAVLGLTDLSLANDLVVYTNGQGIMVKSGQKMVSATVYDLSGKIIAIRSSIGQTELKLAHAAKNTVLIVKIVLENNAVVVKKIMV